MAATSGMSDYERLRAERIAKNAEVLAKLGVMESARAIQLPRPEKKSKGYKPSSKKPREEPVVLRRSLRTRGVSPETEQEMEQDLSTSPAKKVDFQAPQVSWDEPVPFSKMDVAGDEPRFYGPILDCSKTERTSGEVKHTEGFDPSKLKLDPNDVARMVPDRIFSVTFLPLVGKRVVLVGDKSGNVGVWDAEYDHENPVRLYKPHKSPVSCIASVAGNTTQVVTVSYDGLVLLMDMEQESFRRLHDADEELTAFCYPSEGGRFYVAQGDGEFKGVDSRTSNASTLHKLHERRINTIDFNSQRPHLFVTGSTDSKVALWDVRKLADSVSTMAHKKAVSSAYFSPSGNQVVSTSYDDRVGLWKMRSGMDEMEEPIMIHHNNQTNRWISTFRAIWSLDSTHVYIANMSRHIDVISSDTKTIVSRLSSDSMTSIPCRLAQHPLLPGCLAGAAAGGKVYLWTI